MNEGLAYTFGEVFLGRYLITKILCFRVHLRVLLHYMHLRLECFLSRPRLTERSILNDLLLELGICIFI
jgi:hypothetical protein